MAAFFAGLASAVSFSALGLAFSDGFSAVFTLSAFSALAVSGLAFSFFGFQLWLLLSWPGFGLVFYAVFAVFGRFTFGNGFLCFFQLSQFIAFGSGFALCFFSTRLKCAFFSCQCAFFLSSFLLGLCFTGCSSALFSLTLAALFCSALRSFTLGQPRRVEYVRTLPSL